jgi:hypothetical protein
MKPVPFQAIAPAGDVRPRWRQRDRPEERDFRRIAERLHRRRIAFLIGFTGLASSH